jgi:hypothetical protein
MNVSRQVGRITRIAAAVAVAASIVAPAGAQAYDGSPCGGQWWHGYYGSYVQNCPLWRAGVPVRNHANANYYDADGPGTTIVGYLTYGGWANWFYYQCRGDAYSASGATNDWWGKTVADNGREGYVSEVYFSGGNDYERDRGLRLIPKQWEGTPPDQRWC